MKTRFSCIVKRWIYGRKALAIGTNTLVVILMYFRVYTLKKSFYLLGNMLSMLNASLETSIKINAIYCIKQ